MGVRRQASRERGASLVEFALLLPVFMMLVLGMFSGGQAYNKKLDVTSATREGARFGATLDDSTANWATEVRKIVVARGPDIDAADVCVALVSGSGGTLIVHESTNGSSECPDADDSGVDTGKRVQVTAATDAKIEALIYSHDLTVRASAVAKYELD